MGNAVSVLNLTVIALLVVVVVYMYLQMQSMSKYHDLNERQLTNLVSDINYNNWVIAQNNPDITQV